MIDAADYEDRTVEVDLEKNIVVWVGHVSFIWGDVFSNYCCLVTCEMIIAIILYGKFNAINQYGVK